MKLHSHRIVPLGSGIVIIGGYGLEDHQALNDGFPRGLIYHLTCANRQCKVRKMDQELSIPRLAPAVIPIPDGFSGCT